MIPGYYEDFTEELVFKYSFLFSNAKVSEFSNEVPTNALLDFVEGMVRANQILGMSTVASCSSSAIIF